MEVIKLGRVTIEQRCNHEAKAWIGLLLEMIDEKSLFRSIMQKLM